jgi:hypothetical protein
MGILCTLTFWMFPAVPDSFDEGTTIYTEE